MTMSALPTCAISSRATRQPPALPARALPQPGRRTSPRSGFEGNGGRYAAHALRAAVSGNLMAARAGCPFRAGYRHLHARGEDAVMRDRFSVDQGRFNALQLTFAARRHHPAIAAHALERG